MILLLIFGLIGLISPGWFMACIGMASQTEEEPCLVGMFRVVGGVLAAVALWFLFSRH